MPFGDSKDWFVAGAGRGMGADIAESAPAAGLAAIES
jgi:hypothetical protein